MTQHFEVREVRSDRRDLFDGQKFIRLHESALDTIAHLQGRDKRVVRVKVRDNLEAASERDYLSLDVPVQNPVMHVMSNMQSQKHASTYPRSRIPTSS